MVRALVSFDDQQLKKVDRLAKKNKQSRSQLIREAVNQYVAQKELTWKEVVLKTAGIWKHKNIDTDTYLKNLRSEWDR